MGGFSLLTLGGKICYNKRKTERDMGIGYEKKTSACVAFLGALHHLLAVRLRRGSAGGGEPMGVKLPGGKQYGGRRRRNGT